ncbi:hypothetical protein BC628DRAFT_1045564 [Trametes gibbosa]|nr:hypothetical protein BC628DRAFT_1045564 [Trametes gibbosa]
MLRPHPTPDMELSRSRARRRAERRAHAVCGVRCAVCGVPVLARKTCSVWLVQTRLQWSLGRSVSRRTLSVERGRSARLGTAGLRTAWASRNPGSATVSDIQRTTKSVLYSTHTPYRARHARPGGRRPGGAGAYSLIPALLQRFNASTLQNFKASTLRAFRRDVRTNAGSQYQSSSVHTLNGVDQTGSPRSRRRRRCQTCRSSSSSNSSTWGRCIYG